MGVKEIQERNSRMVLPEVVALKRSPLPTLPCAHEGSVVEWCAKCGANEGRHVRACLHPNPSSPDRETCTRQFVSDKVQACVNCPDYAADLPHPNIAAADRFARSLPHYPAGKFSGRGVVVVGGGKYWPSTWVTCRMLRHVGCTLPVQVWHLGEPERDDRYAKLLQPYGVEVVDALAHPEAAKCRSLTGFNGTAPFEAKSFAVLHSPFQEVLSLDADNYPCADPTPLFTESRYQRTGGVYWPDGGHTEGWTRWDQWGVEKFGPLMGFETGQYLINKATAWRQLNLARWYDDHGDWCYGAAEHHDHGDKGPARVGWAYFRTEPAYYTTQVRWEQVAFVQPGPDGKTPMFCHKCRDKFRLHPTTDFVSTPQTSFCKRYGLPQEEAAFGYLEELRQLLR